MTKDKAGSEYWSGAWESNFSLKGFNPESRHWRNHINRQFGKRFDRLFSEVGSEGKQLLEIGAARSIWLPYFAKQYGLHVTGIDYSEIGCEQAQQILDAENVAAILFWPIFLIPLTP